MCRLIKLCTPKSLLSLNEATYLIETIDFAFNFPVVKLLAYDEMSFT